jgi:predicted nucleic acid-binding protein
MADNIPDVLTDMLEIAAYVYCADQFTKRGTELMTNMGADWRRKFRFRIPVRCPDVWGKDSVREALVETLGFLSEDEFSFDFRQATTSTGLQPYLGFSDPSAQAISPDEVILFSGGLDSLAVTEDVIFKWRLLVEEGRKTGHTFSQPDLIIAATALCHGLTVLSRDTSDYERAHAPVVDPWR